MNTCPSYSWCRETDDGHDDHFAEVVTIPSANHNEPNYIDADLMCLYGATPVICLGGVDLNAAQARQEAVKLREFADRVEALADQLEATAPQVTFAPLPAGELVRCHRDTDGVLHVTFDRAQVLAAALEQPGGRPCP